jgi:hypothetical protein
MKALYFIALSLIVSCKKSGKMDLEAEDSNCWFHGSGNGKAKSDRFHAGRNDKVETQKKL